MTIENRFFASCLCGWQEAYAEKVSALEIGLAHAEAFADTWHARCAHCGASMSGEKGSFVRRWAREHHARKHPPIQSYRPHEPAREIEYRVRIIAPLSHAGREKVLALRRSQLDQAKAEARATP